MQNEMITEQASVRYMKVWTSFVERLKNGEHITLLSYCKSMQVNPIAFRRWLYVNRLSVRDVKAHISEENRQDNSIVPQISTSSSIFVQVHPQSNTAATVNFVRGVNLTLTNGIHLSLQECTIGDLVSLITICNNQCNIKGGV